MQTTQMPSATLMQVSVITTFILHFEDECTDKALWLCIVFSVMNCDILVHVYNCPSPWRDGVCCRGMIGMILAVV